MVRARFLQRERATHETTADLHLYRCGSACARGCRGSADFSATTAEVEPRPRPKFDLRDDDDGQRLVRRRLGERHRDAHDRSRTTTTARSLSAGWRRERSRRSRPEPGARETTGRHGAGRCRRASRAGSKGTSSAQSPPRASTRTRPVRQAPTAARAPASSRRISHRVRRTRAIRTAMTANVFNFNYTARAKHHAPKLLFRHWQDKGKGAGTLRRKSSTAISPRASDLVPGTAGKRCQAPLRGYGGPMMSKALMTRKAVELTGAIGAGIGLWRFTSGDWLGGIALHVRGGRSCCLVHLVDAQGARRPPLLKPRDRIAAMVTAARWL